MFNLQTPPFWLARGERYAGGMRLTEFTRLITDEFGDSEGRWIAHSHMLPALGGTPDELIERGVDPRVVWAQLCEDFDIPEERRLGHDVPGF